MRTVVGLDGTGFEDLGGLLPMLGPAETPLAAVAPLGAGQVVLLADTSPLTNRGLARADNAAFALSLAGDAPVAFLETVHGYGVSAASAACQPPSSGRCSASRSRRSSRCGRRGSASASRRTKRPRAPPPRVEYVDALAGALARAKPEKEHT